MIACVCNNFNEASLDKAIAAAQAKGDVRFRTVFWHASNGEPMKCGKCKEFCEQHIAQKLGAQGNPKEIAL